jgi:hypothetical protein
MPRGRDSSASRSAASSHGVSLGDRHPSQSASHPPLPPMAPPPQAQHHHRQHPQGSSAHTHGSSASVQLPPVTSLSRAPPQPAGVSHSGASAHGNFQPHATPRTGPSKKPGKPGRHKTPEQARYWNTVLSSGSNQSSSASTPQQDHHHGHPSPLPSMQSYFPGSSSRSHASPSQSHDPGHDQPHHPPSRGGSGGGGLHGAPPSFHPTPTRHHDMPGGGHGSSHRLRCAECSMEFNSHAELQSHFQNLHNPDRTYPCKYPGCNKVFGHRSSRSRHEKTHRLAPQM